MAVFYEGRLTACPSLCTSPGLPTYRPLILKHYGVYREALTERAEQPLFSDTKLLERRRILWPQKLPPNFRRGVRVRGRYDNEFR